MLSKLGYHRSGLGATFSGGVLTITGLTVGKPLMISYYINNPTESTVTPSNRSSTGFSSTLDYYTINNVAERLFLGSTIRFVANSVATLEFAGVADNCDYLFTAYQVNC